MFPLMCTQRAMRGLGGMAKAALWATWVPLGCTNVLPNGASEPCPGRWRCEAMNHFIMGFCSATSQSTQLLKWVCICKEKLLLLNTQQSPVYGELDQENLWLPLALLSLGL